MTVFRKARGRLRGAFLSRINIEDSLFKDDRFFELAMKLGSKTMALGAFMEACILAQKHYLTTDNDRLVPLTEWERNAILQHVLDAGLAERRDKGIYVSGSDEQFAWLIQRSNAGKKLKAPRAKRPLTGVKRKLTEANGSKPLTLSLPPTLSPSPALVPSEPTKVSDFVAAYCTRFKERWGTNPPIQGKDAGIVGRLAKGMPLAKFEFLLDAFFQMPDSWIQKAKHPIGVFEMKLNEVVVFAESGEFTTQRQAQQADSSVANAMLIQKIQRGEIK